MQASSCLHPRVWQLYIVPFLRSSFLSQTALLACLWAQSPQSSPWKRPMLRALSTHTELPGSKGLAITYYVYTRSVEGGGGRGRVIHGYCFVWRRAEVWKIQLEMTKLYTWIVRRHIYVYLFFQEPKLLRVWREREHDVMGINDVTRQSIILGQSDHPFQQIWWIGKLWAPFPCLTDERLCS